MAGAWFGKPVAVCGVSGIFSDNSALFLCPLSTNKLRTFRTAFCFDNAEYLLRGLQRTLRCGDNPTRSADQPPPGVDCSRSILKSATRGLAFRLSRVKPATDGVEHLFPITKAARDGVASTFPILRCTPGGVPCPLVGGNGPMAKLGERRRRLSISHKLTAVTARRLGRKHFGEVQLRKEVKVPWQRIKQDLSAPKR